MTRHSNPFMQYRGLDILVWATLFFLWKEYYRVVDPPVMSWIFASITTFFAAFSFYFTYYLLVPNVLNKRGLPGFTLSAILTLIVLAPIRSGLIYLAFSTMLPDQPYLWQFFKSITASAFHIGYAITFSTLIRFFIDRYETQKKLDHITKENLRTELNYLKQQINPHFLFNIYNSIYFLIEENPKMAAAVLLKLSGIMQYQLYECNKEFVNLEKEIENIRNYVELETIRVEETVSVSFSSKINRGNNLIAPFILLTLIENSFKHVSKDGDQLNSVSINIFGLNGDLELKIRNSLNKHQTFNTNGIGITNVKRRLELLYPGKHELSTFTENGFYNTILKMEL